MPGASARAPRAADTVTSERISVTGLVQHDPGGGAEDFTDGGYIVGYDFAPTAGTGAVIVRNGLAGRILLNLKEGVAGAHVELPEEAWRPFEAKEAGSLHAAITGAGLVLYLVKASIPASS